MDVNIEYRKPPVIERVASLYADIPEELFESRFEEWRHIVEQAFPIYEPLKHWDLNFESKGDPKEPIPILTSSQPQLRITPRFSRRHSVEGFDWSIRCPRGQFTMNMHPDPSDGSGRRYAQLRHEFISWAEKWISHFEVKKIKLLNLHYVNVLNKTTVPSFFSQDGTEFALAEIINVFVNVAKNGEQMIPPFACQANVRLPDKENATFTIAVQDSSSSPHAPGISINFIVNVEPTSLESSAHKITELLDWSHERIVERFQYVFSERAKQSFEPLK